MSKTYLVTGGAGFIGSHLCDALVGRGDKVVVLDDLSSGKRGNLIETSTGVTLIEGDIRNLPLFEAQIPPVDGIIHLAALISGYDSLTSPDEYDDVNIRGTLRVIEFAARRNVGRIVFASSSTVYGNNASESLTEVTPPSPTTVYALTKLTGEHLFALYGELHGFSHCSLRLFNVYGPRQATDHPYANVTCNFSHAAANRLPVKRYGDGEQSRDFVFVADVVDAFLAVLDRSDQAIYNVGTGQNRSINDLLRTLGEMTGEPLEVEQCDAWANDIRRIRADTGRFEREFGFRPSVTLAEGLEATVAFFRERTPTAAVDA